LLRIRCLRIRCGVSLPISWYDLSFALILTDYAKTGSAAATMLITVSDFWRRRYVGLIMARFGHLLAVQWDLGVSTDDRGERRSYLRKIDPYKAHVIVGLYSFQN
jgi:hypothetical protein